MYACTQSLLGQFLNPFDGIQNVLWVHKSCLAFSNHVLGSPIAFAVLKLCLPFSNCVSSYPIVFAVCDRILVHSRATIVLSKSLEEMDR